MEIKQLEIFANVARTLSFSKTAEEMFISQPSVSASISSLEKSLGVQLLVRNTKGVSLTKTGTDFLIYAQKILSLQEQARQSVCGENRDVCGNIDIISSTIPAQHLLPEIIASFQKTWTNLVFSVEQVDSRRVEREMKNFRYDFGMTGTAPDSGSFVYFPIYDDELVLVVPPDTHESSETIREDFANFITKSPFIMRKPGSGTRVEIEALLSKSGIDCRKLQIRALFSDTHSILLAVSRGLGVSLVSKIAASMYIEAKLLRAVEMGRSQFHRHIYMLRNKEFWLSPALQAFADFARSYYP